MSERPTELSRTRRSGRLVRIAAALAVVVAATSVPSAPVAEASVTILDHRVKPAILVDSDRAGVELGVRFTSTRTGTINAIQFYRNSAQKAAYIGSIWSTSGRRLATARFPAKGVAGWQGARLKKPVQVSARQTLIASYYTPNGSYAATNSAFSRDTRRNGFTIPANGGVYRYGATSGFPTQSWIGSNYFVDIVFRPGPATAPMPPGPKPTPKPTPHRNAYPTLETAGLPRGWKPERAITGDLHIRTAGAVLHDVRVTGGTIFVEAPNVTIRRVEGVGAQVNNFPGSVCSSRLVIEDSTFRRGALGSNPANPPVIGIGGYTARNVLIDGATEGMRVGGTPDCGPVNVIDSYILVMRPDVCGDWHGDGIQGYGGAKLTVRNLVIDFQEDGCGGTAPFFYPADQGNTSVNVDRLVVRGGGYPFRLGTPGSVSNLGVVDQSWGYGPIDVVSCSSLSKWQANVVKLDRNGQPVPIRPLPC